MDDSRKCLFDILTVTQIMFVVIGLVPLHLCFMSSYLTLFDILVQCKVVYNMTWSLAFSSQCLWVVGDQKFHRCIFSASLLKFDTLLCLGYCCHSCGLCILSFVFVLYFCQASFV